MRYENCRLDRLSTFSNYMDSLSSPIDGFLEDHITASEANRILVDDREVGFYAIHGGKLLTAFYLYGDAQRQGQRVFHDILTKSGVSEALVPTCDEFFLSHALDRCIDLKKQAYFFIESGKRVALKKSTMHVAYRIADPADLPRIVRASGDFLDDPRKSIENRTVHIGFFKGELIAVGLSIRSKLWDNQASIGMFTHEDYRQKGVGTQTILYLRRYCHTEGLEALAGCGYANRNSKRTLEAAGMITKTRLLRIGLG